MALRIRRGLSTNRTSITPAEGELIYTTDTKLVYIGDGSTAGGNAVGPGSTLNQYLQVANADAKFATKAYAAANSYVNSILANTNSYIATKVNTTTFNSALANTNSYIASRASWSALTGTNTALRTLISDRLQVANAAATYETKATADSRLANTNAYIATKVNTTTFNSALANTNSFIKSQLANTNAYIASRASWNALTSTNTALRTLINDRLQVANADAKFATKSYAAANSYVNNTFLKRTGSQASAQSVNTNVSFSANVAIQGKLTVTGGITSYFANNVSTSDNMIYLNANSTVTNPDLGFAGNYNDGTYAHAGFFRDASDAGTFKVFHKYTLEPDANVYINTAHASFELAPFAAQNIRATRNLIVVANSTLGNTSVSGFLKLNGTDIRTTFAQNTYVNTTLANTNSYIATRASWTALTGTNTALRTLISDRLQVANAAATYAPIASPTFTGTLSAPLIVSTQSSGNEGGQIELALAASGTTLSGAVAIDIYQNKLRIFETGGSNRGAYIDLSAASTGVGSNLLAGGGGGGGFANGQSISVLNFTVTGNSTLGGAGKTIDSTGALTHTGRVRVSTNLYVAGNTVLGDPTNVSERTTVNGTLFANGNANFSGNTTVSGLIANGSLGTANYVLKTNGTTTFWGAVSSGGGGATLSNETASATTHYPAMSTTSSGTWSSAIVSTTKLYFTPSTGQLNATIFNSLSDKRVKKNIKIVDDALNTVNSMRGVKFNWKETDTPSIGLIAQEVEKLLPELVHTSDNGEKSINYGGVVGVLIEAIKELTSRVEKLEGK